MLREGITSEDAGALRSALRADFLSLSDLEAAELLRANAQRRVAQGEAYRAASGRKRIAKVVETLALNLDGLEGAEREEFLSLLSAKIQG